MASPLVAVCLVGFHDAAPETSQRSVASLLLIRVVLQ
jgi:hypothetical protein